MLDDAEINVRFIYHPPSKDQARTYEENRNRAHYYADFLRLNFPDSRELSLALTKLEEVVMWSNAALARRTHDL